MVCPFCKDSTVVLSDDNKNIHLYCLGDFYLSQELYNGVEDLIQQAATTHQMSVESVRCFLKYRIANEIAFSDKKYFIKKDIETILSNICHLTPAQRINKLILYIGEKTEQSGVSLRECINEPDKQRSLNQVSSIGEFVDWKAMIKTMTDADFKHFFSLGNKHLDISLTNKGWEKFQYLKRLQGQRKVFMAMSFGKEADRSDEQRRNFFKNSIKKPLKKYGFNVSRVDDKIRAGLIDSQILHDIESSVFLIADISDNNLGVYWEAGYAEGHGIPVLYIINNATTEKPHFDVQHRQRIDFKNEKDLSKKLKKFVLDNFTNKEILQ